MSTPTLPGLRAAQPAVPPTGAQQRVLRTLEQTEALAEQAREGVELLSKQHQLLQRGHILRHLDEARKLLREERRAFAAHLKGQAP